MNEILALATERNLDFHDIIVNFVFRSASLKTGAI